VAVDDEVTRDQRILLDTALSFIDRTCPVTKVRERAYDDAAFAGAYRRQAGELGWYSLLVSEDVGGGSVSDNGVEDAALVAYTRGRRLQPDPFVGTNVVAYAVATDGNDEQRAKVLPSLLSGEAGGAWLIAGSNRPVLEGPVQAQLSADAIELSGRASFVQHPGPDGWLLVTAATEAGPTQVLLPRGSPGVTLVPLDGLDVTRHFVDVQLEGVRLPTSAIVGEPGAAADLVARQLALASALTAAESVGAMDTDLTTAVTYAKERIAFGRPIGSFQAIKHLLADTSLTLEMSKAVTLAAARSVGANEYGLEAASIAKAQVGDSGIELGQNCFQVFGGIGYTWEHDQHLYLRRITTDASLYGDAAWHRERLCQLSGLTAEGSI
jgi:alkylation response protein AidB-like acyl-CoA dehydrogenase